MNKLFMLPFLGLAGCINISVAEPSVCETQLASFDLPPIPSVPSVNVTADIPVFSQTQSFNFSSTLDKLTDITSAVNVMVQSLTLSNSNGEFDWVTYAQVSMSAPGFPEMVLGTYNATANNLGKDINLLPALQANPNVTLKYFEQNPLNLTITLGKGDGTPISLATAQKLESYNGVINSSIKVCLSASASKSF
jgi:hypothetical protein